MSVRLKVKKKINNSGFTAVKINDEFIVNVCGFDNFK